jgi:hypothetical protein
MTEYPPELEQLLSLPVQQGRVGLDQVAVFLNRQYATHLRDGELSSPDTGGEAVLADGYILLNASTWISHRIPEESGLNTNVRKIYFTVSKTPCFPLERFIQISGAITKPPGTYPPNYRLYHYRGGEVNMSASVSYPDFECITDINMAVN